MDARVQQAATESEIMRHTFKCIMANARLLASMVALLMLAFMHSFVLFKVFWVWLSMAFFCSFLKAVTLQHAQLRRLSTLGGNIDPVNLRLTLMDRDFTESDYEMLLALDESTPPVKPRGASQDVINSIPCETLSASWITKCTSVQQEYIWNGCTICLDSFDVGQTVRILHCAHLFHKSCVDKWLSTCQPLCPVCKQDVTDKPQGIGRPNGVVSTTLSAKMHS